jgi:hypothetical protein
LPLRVASFSGLSIIGGKYIATITDPINKYDEIYTKCGCLTALSVMFGMG